MREVWRLMARSLVVALPLLAVMLIQPATASADTVPVSCSNWQDNTVELNSIGYTVYCNTWTPQEAPQPYQYCGGGADATDHCIRWDSYNLSYEREPAVINSPQVPAGWLPITCNSWVSDQNPGFNVTVGCSDWTPSTAPQPTRTCDYGNDNQFCPSWTTSLMAYEVQVAPTTPPPVQIAGPLTLDGDQFAVISAAAGILVFFSGAAFVASFRRR